MKRNRTRGEVFKKIQSDTKNDCSSKHSQLVPPVVEDLVQCSVVSQSQCGQSEQGPIRQCSPYHSVAAYRRAYAGHVRPIAQQKDWGEPQYLVNPPNYSQAPERPKKNQIRGEEEDCPLKRQNRKCGQCGMPGHNKRSCKGPVVTRARGGAQGSSTGGAQGSSSDGAKGAKVPPTTQPAAAATRGGSSQTTPVPQPSIRLPCPPPKQVPRQKGRKYLPTNWFGPSTLP